MILAESSPSAVMAAVHFGIACASHIMKTIKITRLLVGRFLNRWYNVKGLFGLGFPIATELSSHLVPVLHVP